MATRRGRSPSPQGKVPEELQKQHENAKKAMAKRSKKQSGLSGIYNQYGYHIVIGSLVIMILVAVGSVVFSNKKDPKITPVNDQEEFENYAQLNLPFTVGPVEFFNQMMLADAKKLLNTQLAHKQSLQYCPTHEDSSIVPDKYNFRTAHPECAQPILDQGNCSSSYAVTAVSVVSDRHCLLEGAAIDLSPQPLLVCDKNFTMGCEGGYVSRTYDYAKRHGLVTSKCLPFDPENLEFEQCEKIASCEKKKIMGQCVASKEEGIKREIYQNGPVVAVIPIYRDFLIYKEGIYEVQEGTSRFQSGHALKVIGWDRDENDKDYWIVENSWGESWGEKGFARVYTKQKDLYLDDYALAPIISAPPKPDEVTDDAPPSQPETLTKEEEVEVENIDD